MHVHLVKRNHWYCRSPLYMYVSLLSHSVLRFIGWNVLQKLVWCVLSRSSNKLKISLWILHCVLADWSQLTFVKKQIIRVHFKILHFFERKHELATQMVATAGQMIFGLKDWTATKSWWPVFPQNRKIGKYIHYCFFVALTAFFVSLDSQSKHSLINWTAMGGKVIYSLVIKILFLWPS